MFSQEEKELAKENKNKNAFEKIENEVKAEEKAKNSGNSKKVIAISSVCVAVVAVIIAVVLINPFGNGGSVLKPDKFLQGVTIDSVDLSDMTLSEAKAALKDTEEKLANEYKEMFLTYDSLKLTVSKEDLGITFNTDEVLDKLMKKSKNGQVDSGKIKAKLSFDGVKKKLQNLANEIDEEATDATEFEFDFETREFKYKNGVDGKKLNMDATMLAFVNKCMAKDGGEVGIVVDPVKFEGVNEEIFNKMGVMATFSTWSTNSYNSTYNMGLAMQKMNGHIIEPGGIFSFHGAVGDSTKAANGWLPSGAWRGGKMVYDEYGGGICQAASTLYNCALYAGIEIVERHCHLQPSSYVPIGLDATVDYPWLDTRVRNNTEYPIYIVSEMIDNELKMTMYGYISDEWDEIILNSYSTSYTPVPKTVYEVDESLKDGEYKLEKPGLPGQTASASRSFYKDGECIRFESLTNSTYSSVAPLYKVGKNTDTSKVSGESGTALLEKPEEEKPESSKPESSKPESSAPESSVPESSKPESSVPESSTPESSVPESSATEPDPADPNV